MSTEYGDISLRTAAWAVPEFLAHADPILVLQKLGMVKAIPKNKGDTVKFRRSVPYGPVTAPLVEGVTPEPQDYSVEDVTAILQQWGSYNVITDKVVDVHEDPILKEMMQLSGEQAAETLESVEWGVLKAGTNVIYGNGTQRTDVNTPITIGKIRAAIRTLRNQRAKMITSILAPSTNISTRPIEGGFVALGHSDLDADIRQLPGFTPVAAYGSRKPIVEQELGSVENVRFITSPLLSPIINAGGADGDVVLSTGGTSADVYPLLIIGKDAFGAVVLKGADSMKPMVLNPNVPRGGDPLGQRGSVGWKTWFTAVILNQAWMVRIETAASVLA